MIHPPRSKKPPVRPEPAPYGPGDATPERPVRPRVSVWPQRILYDPPVVVYFVAVESDAAVWKETFGSREQLDAFLRGVQAAGSFFGWFPLGADIIEHPVEIKTT